MRKGGPSSKDAAFKASKSKKEKERNYCSDKSDVESKLAQFVSRLKRGSKLKGKYPLICFECGKIGHYAAKCPHKHDSDDEGNSKIMAYKKKGFNKKTSSPSKMSLMRMSSWSSKRNQMRKVIMMKAKKHYSWHSQMMMTQGWKEM